MRVITFNIQNRRRERSADLEHRMAECVRFIRALKPDLLCLQEVIPQAWPLLCAGLNPTATEYVPRRDGRKIGEAAPVLNLSEKLRTTGKETFWFSETPHEPSVAWNAAHPRTCSALRLQHPDRAPCWVMNVHLDHRSPLARRNSLKILRKHILNRLDEGHEIILCGDFNTPPYHASMLAFLAGIPALSDAVHLHPVHQMTPTFLGWGPFKFAKARIDRCLHSRGWHADHYEAVTPRHNSSMLSDHRAVVVDLSPCKSAG